MRLIRDWFQRHFSDPQVVILVGLLIVVFATIYFLGRLVVPFLVGLVMAYLLEGLVRLLTRWYIPRLLAVLIVFFGFMTGSLFAMFWLLPLLTKQVAQLVQQIPGLITQTQALLLQLPERYPNFISDEQVVEFTSALRTELFNFGQRLLTFSVASLTGLITLIVYLIIVPMLIFFFLKDKNAIMGWMSTFLPRERRLASQVWHEVDRQIGNYIRGKFLEILIIWAGTYATFYWLGLQNAMLLGLVVGLSVLIPYIGAAVVTLPVAIVAYAQWGFGDQLLYVLIAYAIIQAIDGNILAPLLFSEAVDIHPVAIILAILVFGGLWGFWGIFFAIPLATVVQAVLRAWPRPVATPVSQLPPETSPSE
ncbi:MAG: AI-2E family transporter [Desulfovibrionales bacterium]|nr:MAG: AI-2E family transporter [Desulfovibrionales bacterium]